MFSHAVARYLKYRRAAPLVLRPGRAGRKAPQPSPILPTTDNIVDVSPYLCRPTRRFDLMVGPYTGLAKAHLRRRQIQKFDAAPGILRVIKVPSGYWVIREIAPEH